MIYVKTVKRGTGQFSMDVPILVAGTRENLENDYLAWLCTRVGASSEWDRDKRGQLVTATTILTDSRAITRE